MAACPSHVSPTRIAVALLGLVAFLAPVGLACAGLDEPDQPAPGARGALVEARVLSSRAEPLPVGGAILILEPDADSTRPFSGPGQSFLTHHDGWVRARVLSSGGGVTKVASARLGGTPLEGGARRSLGDACVHFVHEGTFSTPRCGLALELGRAIAAGDFFLEDFAIPPGAAAE